MSDPRQLRRAFLRQLRELGYGCIFRHAGWCEVLVFRGEERWTGAGRDRRAALAAVLARMFPSEAARASLLPTRKPDVLAPIVAAPARAPAPAPLQVLWIPPAPPAPRLSPAELELLHEELSELIATLESLFVDVLEWAPERQRLLALAWVARARDIQGRARHDSSIEQRVSGFCSRLGSLTKISWPGNVPALAASALPIDCWRELELRADDELPDWLSVADRAEALLERLDAAGPASGLDEQGWADAAWLEPQPPEPRALFNELRAQLQGWSGPIPDAQAILDGAEFGGEPPASLVQSLPADPTRLELLRVARKLRWLRGCDLRGWGESLGRVRWIAHRARHLWTLDLETALDPRARPRQAWAKECGFDPEARLRKQRKNELYKQLPTLARGDLQALAGWLAAAVELGQEMSNEKLAAALCERVDDLLALSAEAFATRTQRKRVRRLQDLARGVPQSGEIEDADEETEEPCAPAPQAASEPIAARVLAFTRGKRTLIVGNRADPALDAALEHEFELSRLDRCDLSPNRVESHAERIRSGSYGLVLAITGFMSHKTDQALRKACLFADVPFVRVNKGRPAACARHIARELGFQPDTPSLST